MAARTRRTALRCALTLAALAAALAPARAAAAPRALPACPAAVPYLPCIAYGTPEPLGAGTARSYAVLHGARPLAVGLLLDGDSLSDLPTEMTDRHHCFDVNGDGAIEEPTECAGGHEHVLDLPAALRGLPGMPLRWLLLNWDPMGHGPAGVYDRAHFDVHFFLASKAERDAIRPGPCAIVVDCEDFATATRPLPPEHLPPGHTDKGLVEVAMGNHLTDQNSPEWHGGPFTRTFVYGAYDGRITFLEPMVTAAALHAAEAVPAPAPCLPVSQPEAFRTPGWYPRRYCVRHSPAPAPHWTVSLEDFAPHR